jgi:hypothetical protein
MVSGVWNKMVLSWIHLEEPENYEKCSRLLVIWPEFEQGTIIVLPLVNASRIYLNNTPTTKCAVLD